MLRETPSEKAVPPEGQGSNNHSQRDCFTVLLEQRYEIQWDDLTSAGRGHRTGGHKTPFLLIAAGQGAKHPAGDGLSYAVAQSGLSCCLMQWLHMTPACTRGSPGQVSHLPAPPAIAA